MAQQNVKVTTDVDGTTFRQEFVSDQPVTQEAIKQAIAQALFHLGIRPKR
jgi:hypothetical protein